MSKISLSSAIREGLHEEMLKDENVICIGEDIGVMNGTFAVTKGFLDEFGPKRVWDTPISESGFTGLAVALLGKNNPFGILVAAIFYAALEVGGQMLQQRYQIDKEIVFIIQALIIIFVASENLFKFMLNKKKAA